MMMYKHPNIWKSNQFAKFLGKMVVNIAKNLLGVLSQDKVGVKKAYRKVRNILENAFFVTTPPNRKKLGLKSEK